MSEHGFIVIRRGQPTSAPAAAGDLVDVYPLGAPLDLTQAAGAGVPGADFDPHRAAHAFGPMLRTAGLREVGRVSCAEGHEPRSLAIAYANTAGRVWVLVRPERVPKAHRGSRLPGPSAWPLHTEPNGVPHVEITSCGRCRRTWALAITERGLTRVDMARPLYSRRVTA